MTVVPSSPVSRRFRDYKFEYDSDLSDNSDRRKFILSQRTYANPDPNGEQIFEFEEFGQNLTPLTSSFFERTRNFEGIQPRVKPFEPRKVVAYYSYNNKQGFVQRTAFLPFLPSDRKFYQHLKEIREFKGVECFSYRGESHNNTSFLINNYRRF